MYGKRSFSPIFNGLVSSLLSVYVCCSAHAEQIEVIEISGKKPPISQLLGSSQAALEQQGVQFSSAGGVATAPVLNGLTGDRVKIQIDGAEVTASCANHMNPPMSYVSANQLTHLAVFAGVSPVSKGGDNIAGVIELESMQPKFSQQNRLSWHSGYSSVLFRTNDHAKLLGLGLSLNSKEYSLNYQGAYETADSYEDGDGALVYDTLYEVQNHALTGAYRDKQRQWSIKLTHQNIPFQGFANQYMDMTNNKSLGVVMQLEQQLTEGQINANFSWQGVEHEMGFFSKEKTGHMPMNTEADNLSLRLKWQHPISSAHSLSGGAEYYRYSIDDWWPAVAGSMMMGPNDYVNIQDGKRDRLALYLESNRDFTEQWLVSAGVRAERVSTNTGEVQAYNSAPMMGRPNVDHQAAESFNAAQRARTDTLVDVTLLARYQQNQQQQWQFAFARKSRAPNLYERYSWGRGTMATTMIGWFGDGNGYVGDINIKPETATTLSASFHYSTADLATQLSVRPYYTQVRDYIDAKVIGRFRAFRQKKNPQATRNKLQFVNLDATLFGLNFDLKQRLTDNASVGRWDLNFQADYVRGRRDQSNENLYQIQPPILNLSLQHKKGNWQTQLNWKWTGKKDKVDIRRREQQTAAYSLLNIYSQYSWQHMDFSFSIENLLDERYQLPLSGVNVADVRMKRALGFEPLAGKGRSFNLGVRFNF